MSSFCLKIFLSKLILTFFFFDLGGGWAGTSYFIDPTTGIAVVFGVEIAPTKDVELFKVGPKLESTLYQGLTVLV